MSRGGTLMSKFVGRAKARGSFGQFKAVRRSQLLRTTSLAPSVLLLSLGAPMAAPAQPPIVAAPVAVVVVNNNDCDDVGDCIFISTVCGASIDLTNNGTL